MTTLRVTVGEADRLQRETIQRIRKAEAGEPLEDHQPVLNFEDYATLARFLTGPNLELLETIAEDGPESIRETARLVERDYREVHRNLSELESLGIIHFEGDGQGTAKRPILAYDAIEISLSLGEESPEYDLALP